MFCKALSAIFIDIDHLIIRLLRIFNAVIAYLAAFVATYLRLYVGIKKATVLDCSKTAAGKIQIIYCNILLLDKFQLNGGLTVFA